jgi:hypothetical protein
MIISVLASAASAFKFPAQWNHKYTTWGKIDRSVKGDTVTLVYKSYVTYFEQIPNLIKKKLITADAIKDKLADLNQSSLALISIYGSDIYKTIPSYELVKGTDYTYKYTFDISDEVFDREQLYNAIPEDLLTYKYSTKEERIEKETAIKEECKKHGFLYLSTLLGDKQNTVMRDYKGLYEIYKPILKPFVEDLTVKIINTLKNFNNGKAAIVDIIISLGEFVALMEYKNPGNTFTQNGKKYLTGNIWTPYAVLLQASGDCDSKNLLFTVMLGVMRDTIIALDEKKYPKLADMKKEMLKCDFKLLAFPPKPGSSVGHLFAAVRLPYQQVAPSVLIGGELFSLMDVTGEYIPGYETGWGKLIKTAEIIDLLD